MVSFRALFAANVRVCAIALVLAGVAYGIWRALRIAFPEIGWLQ